MISYERLCIALRDNNWPLLIETLKPKCFPRDEQGNLVDKQILTKVAETLEAPQSSHVPDNVRIQLLKCLVNSCVDGYTQQTIDGPSASSESFPYNRTVRWAVDFILRNADTSDDSKDRLEILRLCVQLLCNLFTFAFTSDNLPHPLMENEFKSALTRLVACDSAPLARAACAFAYNTLRNTELAYWDETQMRRLVEASVKADELGIPSAGEILRLFLRRPSQLIAVYQELTPETRLYLLELVRQDVSESVYSDRNTDSETSTTFPSQLFQFLCERFKRRSDLILKTEDSYLDGVEPTEVTLLLDIIGLVSSGESVECRLVQSDKSLVINCIYLLKSLHMAGKESNNYFTPVQKLSEVAPCSQEIEKDSFGQGKIQDHPAFGFKAGLIRAIGNLVHKHKANQKLLRETDAISLLLDCCNIDARNPLIMQWAILALKNACDQSPENQQIIRNCNRIGVIDNEIIREMGIELHAAEDGKAIGILPLPREINK